MINVSKEGICVFLKERVKKQEKKIYKRKEQRNEKERRQFAVSSRRLSAEGREPLVDRLVETSRRSHENLFVALEESKKIAEKNFFTNNRFLSMKT